MFMEGLLWPDGILGTEDTAVDKTMPLWNLRCVIHPTHKWQLIKKLFKFFDFGGKRIPWSLDGEESIKA